MAETDTELRCYRHPGVETAVSCSDCERPICTDCMVFGPVGIRCPQCAVQASASTRPARPIRPVRQPAQRARGGLLAASGPVTKLLIAINVVVYVTSVAQANRADGFGSDLFVQGALFGPAVADGDWWRLVTAGFLHGGPIHILFNMLMLWWYGQALENLLGPVRFLSVYAVSILAGSAGALLLAPDVPTVGASGAVFGILGAGLYLERRQIYVFGGGAFAVVAINVVLSFVLSNISVGGHLGGLAGGILAAFALSRFGRGHAAYGRLGPEGVVGLVVIAVVSVAIAYLRVRNGI